MKYDMNKVTRPVGKIAKRARFYCQAKANRSRFKAVDIIMVRVAGREIQAELPHGFWRQDEEARQTQIAKKWPLATWAGNGCGGMDAINHYFD